MRYGGDGQGASGHFSDMPRLRCPLIGGKADLHMGALERFFSHLGRPIRVIRLAYEIRR